MSERQTTWLELELTRQLRPVEAPASLWERIHEPPIPRRESSFHWGWWAAAAALLLMASGAAWRKSLVRDPSSAMEKLAEQELRGPREFDFRSRDPVEIRAWLKTNANIELDLSGSGAVQLLGVRLIRLDGAPIAAVAYKAGGGVATLLVSRRRADDKIARATGRFFNWATREQVYTLASSEGAKAACLLCHSAGTG